MSRRGRHPKRHPKKDVEQALEEAEAEGWTVEHTASGHRWGVARCPVGSSPGEDRGCSISVWSTPKNPGNHAKAIARAVKRCPHRDEAQEEQEEESE